jgi:hypothetical protein
MLSLRHVTQVKFAYVTLMIFQVVEDWTRVYSEVLVVFPRQMPARITISHRAFSFF